MQFAAGGTVSEAIKAADHGRLSESKSRSIIVQVVSALDYVHRIHKIVHRDLKCDNILLSIEGDAKVADFGVSSVVSPMAKNLYGFVGTPDYMAPEVLCSEGGNYGSAVDYWSLGVILCAFVY